LVTLLPGSDGAEHQLTREETIVGTAGRAVATLGGVAYDMVAGCAMIIQDQDQDQNQDQDQDQLFSHRVRGAAEKCDCGAREESIIMESKW
jgi:hypothetical protein